MSANIAVINFTCGGTLAVSGRTTLGDQLLSTSAASFQGIATTSLAVSGASTFNGSLPTSTQTPTSDTQLTTKVYVDTKISTLNTSLLSYVDESYGVLDNQVQGYIRDTDLARKLYMDASYGVLNTRVTDTDAAQRLYVDASYGVLNKRVTDTDAAQRLYVDASYGVLNTRVTDTDAAQRLYVDASYGVLNSRVTSIDTAIQALNYPGKVVFMKGWSSNVYYAATIFNPIIDSKTWTWITFPTFKPISPNNFLKITFDCNYSVTGSADSGNDTFNARIMVNNTQCGYKTVNLGGYRSSGTLFPLSAYAPAQSATTNQGYINIEVMAQQGTANDILTIDADNWVLTVSEMTPYVLI